jgi:hypothetical protein
VVPEVQVSDLPVSLPQYKENLHKGKTCHIVVRLPYSISVRVVK